MRHRLSPSILALALAACSASEGTLEKPDVGVGPVEAVTLELHNALSEDLYVAWSGNRPVFTLEKNATTLQTERGCNPLCGEACSCPACDAPSTHVLRIAAGETYTLPWKPVHYVQAICNGSSECACVERWPVTAGHYALLMDAFTQAEGGEPSQDNPNVLVNATQSERSRSCAARGELDLGSDATVRAVFVCP